MLFRFYILVFHCFVSANALFVSPSWSSYFMARFNKSAFFFCSPLCDPLFFLRAGIAAAVNMYKFLIMWSIALRKMA